MLGAPFDPFLAAFYRRFDGGLFGDLHISSFKATPDSLVPFNERSREQAEPRLRLLVRYGGISGLAEDLATVPALAEPGGAQPVVYLEKYLDKIISPFASNVDRAFDLYARYCDEQIALCGSLWASPPSGHAHLHFPFSYVEQVAQDEPLVRLLAEGRFDELVLPYEASREWVQSILRTARAS